MTTVQLVNPNSVSKQRAATPVVPIFRDSAFDAEATGALGSAYDIACRALHPQGQPPVIQEQLARKIIEAAARGERDPERLATAALAILGPFHRDVTRRFGLVPNFFMSAPEAPEILEKLWDFAGSAYLDNPIPSLFKERLFVFLSRFCQVRYCIVRHCGFLVGYGYIGRRFGAATNHWASAPASEGVAAVAARTRTNLRKVGSLQDATRLA